MKASNLLMMCWLLANAEAKYLGATEIEPVHFLLALLKVADPTFTQRLEQENFPKGALRSISKEAQELRHYIEVMPEVMTAKRRTLRAKLHQLRENPAITQEGLLHRSPKLKEAFALAQQTTTGDSLSLHQLIHTLFLLKLIDLSEIDTY